MNLSKKDGYLIIVAVIICIIISCLSPFIASGNPDGLEKSAEDAGLAEDYGVDGLNEIYSSPFPDYTFEPLGSLGEIGVLILGAVICLAIPPKFFSSFSISFFKFITSFFHIFILDFRNFLEINNWQTLLKHLS